MTLCKLYSIVVRSLSDEFEEVFLGRKNSIVGWLQKYQNEAEVARKNSLTH
jgi:hypothetical protein